MYCEFCVILRRPPIDGFLTKILTALTQIFQHWRSSDLVLRPKSAFAMCNFCLQQQNWAGVSYSIKPALFKKSEAIQRREWIFSERLEMREKYLLQMNCRPSNQRHELTNWFQVVFKCKNTICPTSTITWHDHVTPYAIMWNNLCIRQAKIKQTKPHLWCNHVCGNDFDA